MKVHMSTTTNRSFWDHLPPQLTDLSMNSSIRREDGMPPLEIASKLPRSLTKFRGFLRGATLPLSLLPPSLTNWNFHWLLDYYDTWELDHFNLGQHFLNLKMIQVPSVTNQLLRVLPPTVSHLCTDSIETSIDTALWPASLTHVDIRDTDQSFLITKMPSGLVELTLDGSVVLDTFLLSTLSRSLRSLCAVDGILRENIDFPPHLTRLLLGNCQNYSCWLELSGEQRLDGSAPQGRPPHYLASTGVKVGKCFPYHQLPQSLTELRLVSALPASRLKHLPRRLKILDLVDIFEDADYQPDASLEMEAMKDIFEIGRREGIAESFDWTQLKQTSRATLLPRTLVELSLTGKCLGNDFDWSMIPPYLNDLSTSSPIQTQALATMPLSRMKRLCISLEGDKSDAQHLPSTLYSLYVEDNSF